MNRDYTEPFDYEDLPAFMARQDYEKSMIDERTEEAAYLSVLRAEEADDYRD